MSTHSGTSSRPTAPAQDQELVKGLGLTSATTLVMGSMIGSGIFIVSADIARLVDSPALLIAAWAVTGFMTIVGALCYGELAAMMPKAGGQYVFLRDSLGPLWGFLYGWTFFLVIQCGTIAAVGVAFGKFLGVFFPSVSSTHWILHFWKVPPIHVGPMVLGNMDVGLNTANLAGIVIIVVLSIVNVFGVRTGAMVQNVFTFAKAAALIGLVLVGIFLGRNHVAEVANFGAEFWRRFSWSARFPVEVGVGGPIAMVSMLTIVAVAQVGSLFSADAWNNVTFTAAEVKNPSRNLPLSLAMGTGFVILLYIAANFAYMSVLPLHGDPHGASVIARGIQYAAEDRVATAMMQAVYRPVWRLPDGGGDPGFHLRLQQRAHPGRRARLLRHGQGRPVFPQRRPPASHLQDARGIADGADGLVLHPVSLGNLRAVARLHHLCRAGVLHPDHSRALCPAGEAAERAPAVSRHRLPRVAGHLHLDGPLY